MKDPKVLVAVEFCPWRLSMPVWTSLDTAVAAVVWFYLV